MLRAGGLTASHSDESHDLAEIKEILAVSAAAGQLSHRQVEFASNVLKLVDIETRHILVPRVDIEFLSQRRTVEENLRVIREAGHSRFPLCELDLESVQGIVHARDLIAALLDGSVPDLAKIARQPLFVTGGGSLSRLIRRMRSERRHCAVVLDEYGSTIGMAFLEDALEHVVGTIGGFVVERLGQVPAEGDEITVAGYAVTVEEIERNRVRWLRFRPVTPDSTER